ncbi:hypothetical protein H0E87_017792 [Populus deltoides]|uniref:Uncharacterized protein n=1 Tax=Populus deltoides TaxID=3696 RepID=A0A8T2Y1U5_POPDE|nr:hypothetical protein H0E87_017792 [Populus deltoides]
MFSYMVALTVTLALKFGQGETLSKAISVFLVVIICLFCFAYGKSWGPLGWLVPSELFPLETRSAGQKTKQVPIEEVYLLFQNHWYWKKIVGDGTNDDELDGKKGQAT